MAAEKCEERWVINAKALRRHGGDLVHLANRVADRVILKTALESEFGIRKLETRSLLDPGSFLLLRIQTNILADFITRCQDQGILTDRDGTPTAFTLFKNVIPDLVVQKGRFELLIGDKNFSAKELVITFPPVTLVFGREIFQLDPHTTYPFLKEIPIGKDLPEHRRNSLLKAYAEHGDKLKIHSLDRKKIVTGEKITAILNFDPALRRAQLSFLYDNVIIPDTEEEKTFVETETNIEVHRNFEIEDQLRNFLKKEGFFFRPKEAFKWFLSSRSLSSVYPSLLKKGFSIRVNRHKLCLPPEVKWRFRSDHTHIYLGGTVVFDWGKMSAGALFKAFHRKKGCFKLSNGSYGLISDDIKKRLADLAKIGVMEKDGIKFRRSDFAYVNRQFKDQDDLDTDDGFARLQLFADRFAGIKRYRIPETLNGVLRDYQVLGVNWLRTLKDLSLNGILSDDMGLGKTLQVLALIESLRQENHLHGPVLLVVPKTLIFNWKAEIERFTPQLSYRVYGADGRSVDRTEMEKELLIITSYGQVRQHSDFFCSLDLEYVILDEAQTIKNPNAKISKVLKRIKSRHRLSMTGTPVENSALDLWSQFDFLMPGFLHGKRKFQEKYCQGRKNLEILHTKTKPYILRRLKHQVAEELPDKTEITLYCDFTKEQKKIYNQALGQARMSIHASNSDTPIDILQLILRLRQIACHPAMAVDAEDIALTSGKLESVLNSGREILSEGHKILIFSQFTQHLRLVQRAFDRLKVRSFYLDGKTRDRETVVNRFKSHKGPCLFFISLKTGGTGLNLSEASHVFLLDPWWNPAVENQAIDRCHRIGQTQPVFVIRFITKDSIEEKVNDLKEIKQRIEKSVIDTFEPEYAAVKKPPIDEDTMKQLICG